MIFVKGILQQVQNLVPFFSNTSDNTHCYQAVIKMVAKYLWPDEEFSWEYLEKVTAKHKGLWTWPTAGLLWLQSKGAEVLIVELFDHQEFVNKGNLYLLDYFGPEVGLAQIKKSNVPQEIELAKQALNKISIEKRIPQLNEVTDVLDNGYLVICNVNSNALNNKHGYVGHFVVITGHDDQNLFLHDPGLPPHKDRKVGFEQYKKSWAYPDESVQGYMAIRKKTSVK